MSSSGSGIAAATTAMEDAGGAGPYCGRRYGHGNVLEKRT